MDNILSVILQNTYTLSEFRHRLKILQSQFQQKLFNSSQKDELSPRDTNWLNSLPENFFQLLNKDNFSQTMTELINKENTLQTLVIYLPFETDEEILDQIGMHFRKIFGFPALLDIKHNPQLVAGCALSWKGIYKDYSLHSRIAERSLAISQSFKKFLQ